MSEWSPYANEQHAQLVNACELLGVPYEGKTPNEMLREILSGVRALTAEHRAHEAKLSRLRAVFVDDGA